MTTELRALLGLVALLAVACDANSACEAVCQSQKTSCLEDCEDQCEGSNEPDCLKHCEATCMSDHQGCLLGCNPAPEPNYARPGSTGR